jgi:hypothetical protein
MTCVKEFARVFAYIEITPMKYPRVSRRRPGDLSLLVTFPAPSAPGWLGVASDRTGVKNLPEPS